MSQYMVQFAMCLMLNRTRMYEARLPFSAAVRPQMHIYGQLRSKRMLSADFEIRMNRLACPHEKSGRSCIAIRLGKSD